MALIHGLSTLLTSGPQDGKPYIVSNVARRVVNTSSPLSEGFTISSQSIFKNKEDHDFYDKEVCYPPYDNCGIVLADGPDSDMQCPAHKELKVEFYDSSDDYYI